MLTPILVIGGIVGGIVTPTESAIIAAAYALILGVFVYRNVSFRDLAGIVYNTGRFASISLFAIGTASASGWMLAFYNVPRLIVDVMTAGDFGPIATSLIIAALFPFFGLFIDAIPTIIILGTVLLPVATAAGIEPVAFAIIGIISLAFGLVTPPYGLSLHHPGADAADPAAGHCLSPDRPVAAPDDDADDIPVTGRALNREASVSG